MLSADRLDVSEQVLAAASAGDLYRMRHALVEEEFTYLAAEFLARAAPGIPTEDRWVYADEVVARRGPSEDVAEACRRFGRDSVRAAEAAALRAEMLDDRHNRNDVGNGERFAAEYADQLLFLEDRGVWVRWDGRRWRDASGVWLQRSAKVLVKRVLTEALHLPEAETKEVRAWALSSLSKRNLANLVDCASSEKVFSASAGDFDLHPDLLTVQNGVVDLRTGRLRTHDCADRMTTLTKIAYDPSATCPRWEQFLCEVFADDAELVEFVQRAVGYSMTGHTREHAFFILHGGGRNGKGRFIHQLQALLGDAARTTRFQTFTQSREDGSGNTPALAALAGARLVVAGEPDDGVRLSESVIKMLTGEDAITACRKYEHQFTFFPLFKIWLHCNHKPTIRGTDTGIWSRPKLVPFNVTFKTAEEVAKSGEPVLHRRDPDKRLDAKLSAERAGILAWAVRGAMMWYERGLGSSRVVDAATEAYRAESDRLAPFIEECLRPEVGKFTSCERLYAVYEAWCRKNLVEYQLEGQTLSKQLVARGFVRGKERDVRGFKDLSVAQPTTTLFAVPSAKAN